MAYTAYICRIRTDLDAGAVQITDLAPNTSRRSFPYESHGQSGYLGPRVENDTIAALVGNATVAAYNGLAAYLLDVVADGVTANSITVTRANTAAAAIIADMDAGNAITAASITVDLVAAGCGAGTTVVGAGGAGESAGSLVEVLQILSGATYTLPAGTTRNSGADRPAGTAGSFDLSTYRQQYITGALQISCGQGDLAALASSSFSYRGTTGAAVVVYDYQGTVLT
jgi:hypothetical protein